MQHVGAGIDYLFLHSAAIDKILEAELPPNLLKEFQEKPPSPWSPELDAAHRAACQKATKLLAGSEGDGLREKWANPPGPEE